MNNAADPLEREAAQAKLSRPAGEAPMPAARLHDAQAVQSFDVAVLIVSYGRPQDAAQCLQALARSAATPSLEVFIAENGGPAAFDALIAELTGDLGPCAGASLEDAIPAPQNAARCRCLRLLQVGGGLGAHVHLAQMEQNVGYAGGINAWLRPLLKVRGWQGAWILNPDTAPEPDALGALVDYAAAHGKSLVGSRLVSKFDRSLLQTRGLLWRKLRATVDGVDKHVPAEPEPDVAAVEQRLDAPSGASIYATRDLIENVGLMREHFFLYFEDLEWGIRAKQSGRGIGYAHASIVLHEGGTTLGSSPSRRHRSRLAIYLDTRNRILFVRDNYPFWLIWTAAVCLAETAVSALGGSMTNVGTRLSGVAAGLMGETGKPAWFQKQPSRRHPHATVKKRIKLLISGAYWLGAGALRLLRLSRPQPGSLVVLYYHGVPAPQRDAFARQLASLEKHSEVVPADFVADHGASRRTPVAITFDDGLVSVAENALPELLKREMPCTIFFPSGVLGRYPDWAGEVEHDPADPVMDAQSVSDLPADLVTIAAHSIDHPHLTGLSPEEARVQIADSKASLERLIGRPVSLFSFPYGDFNSEIAQICREAGYSRAYSIIPQVVDTQRDAFVRGRVSVTPEDGPIEFYLKSAGAYSWEQGFRALKRRVSGGVG